MWQRGVTLIELVIVMVVLGAVSIGIATFVRTSVESVVGITDRGQLLNGARFPLERLRRELNGAIPNSIRIHKTNGEHCIQFVPFEWVSVYLNLPVASDTDDEVEMSIIAPQDIDGNPFEIIPNVDKAIIYPLRSEDIYQASDTDTELRKVRNINDCDNSSCTTFTNNILTLLLANGFAEGSPAERLYIAREAVSFCVINNTLIRLSNEITSSQPTSSSGGTIIANNINNTLVTGESDVFAQDDPFQYSASSRFRNAIVQVRLRFLLNAELVTLQEEVHIPNAP